MTRNLLNNVQTTGRLNLTFQSSSPVLVTSSKSVRPGQTWWCSPLITWGSRGRWISEFKDSPVYIVSSRTARATQRNSVSKNKKKKSYTRPLSRDSESKKNLERGYTDPVPKRTQLPAQATIHNKTLNYHRWKNQSIPWENQIHTISMHESSPSNDNKGKTPTQGGKLCPRKSKKVILQQT